MPHGSPKRDAPPTGLLSHSGEFADQLKLDGDGSQPPTTSGAEGSSKPDGIDVVGPAQGETLVGRYQLCEILGGGGFGTVWRARDILLERDVAVKIAHRKAGVDDSHLLHEARTVAKLGLPGLVPIHDVVREADYWFVVSELMAGGSLADRIRDNPPNFLQSAAIVASLAETLHRLHLGGYVHRDIKPANILFDQFGNVFLADFGLAMNEKEVVGQKRGYYGTVRYMSPEQAIGRPDLVDGRSDQFSLGLVLYYLLAKRQPFVDSEVDQYLRQIVERPARPLRSIDDSIPTTLEVVCLRMLEKHVSDRYSTAGDVAIALRRWLVNQSQSAGDAVSDSAHNASFWKRLAFWLSTFAALIVLATLGSTYWPARGSRPTPLADFTNEVDTADKNSVSATGLFQSLNPDAIVIGRTYPLLQSQPESLVGMKVDGVHFDARREQFHLASFGANVFKLGAVNSPSYTLRVNLRQAAAWQGQAGIFLGLHNDPNNPDMLCAQSILVQRSSSKEGQERSMLVLRKEIRLLEGQMQVLPPPGISEYAVSVNAVPAGRTAELEVRVDRGRVESVRFAGDYLPTLAATTLNSAFEGSYYRGGFGILAAQVSGVTFEGATIRVEE